MVMIERAMFWVGVLVMSVPGGANAGLLQVTEAFVLRLDGFEYTMSAGDLVLNETGSITLVAPNRLEQCRRRSGLPQVTSPYRFIHDGLGRFVYLSGPLLWFEGRALRVDTQSGDIVCAGGVAADRVFTNSFE